MRWRGRSESRHIEDRRGNRTTKTVGGISIGALLFYLAYTLLTGEPPEQLPINPKTVPTHQTQGQQKTDELTQFVKVVFKDTEDVWDSIFKHDLQAQYRYPTLVIYSGMTQAGCGWAQSATGPFYCPADEKIYVDLDFFRELKRRFGAGGDFAIAYIIAHEVGHHVQKLLGITGKVEQLRRRMSKREFNKLSVRLELQADYLAGVWAKNIEKTKHVLEPGDIEEAIGAAQAVGDDRLQKKYQGYVVPDAFTHGTSNQRMRWFIRGFKYGDLNHGDTFGINYEAL